MKKFLLLITLIMLVFVTCSKAEAKWWIFGQGNDEITINYIYINKSSFDETGEKITIYKDTLQNGMVNINGKASVRRGKIGAVFVSKDNKNTWEKAELSNNGSFQYNFRPEIGKEYEIAVEINDTTGKTNDVAKTYRKLTVVNENITKVVAQTLDALVKAYQNEETNLFMSQVSPDFIGDSAVLDSAIRRDFNAFDYIQLRYFINNISSDSTGRIFVSINYIRTVVSTRSGRTFSDNGFTEIVFKNHGGTPKILSMKNPLIFGLSDAGNVATGTIQSANNNPIILVDESGNVNEQPFRTAIDIIENGSDAASGSSSGVQSGTVTVANGPVNIRGYIFYYNNMMPNELQAPNLANTKSLGNTDIDSVDSVTVTNIDNDFIVLIPGESAAVKMSDGKYMLIEHVSGAGVGSVIKYRFQPDGTSNF